MVPKPDLIIYTDLDGTLLDHETYSWEAAKPALTEIRDRKIPLVLCSSKTRAELEPLRSDLGIHDPFITENGGGIYIPLEYFPQAIPESRRTDEYHLIELGTAYRELRSAFEAIRKETGVPMTGYGDMNEKEVARRTGLSQAEAVRAKQREYDEPFVIEADEKDHVRVLEAIRSSGLEWTKGGRFYHLSGSHDKGRAAARLTPLYREIYRRITTVGLGEGPNDLSLLRIVEHPVLIQRKDGTYLEAELQNADRPEGIGPMGWNLAVLALIRSL
jgi:mannosyl-3-phosphoglycerate phosphatase